MIPQFFMWFPESNSQQLCFNYLMVKISFYKQIDDYWLVFFSF